LLDEVLRSKFYSVRYVAADPDFHNLRDHPRFQALLEKYDTSP
jgi:hypothetical protein